MPIVTFVTDKKQVQVPEGANLRKEAIKAGVRIYNGMNGIGAGLNEIFNCQGLGTCGTCRVLIAKGQENASPMRTLEKLNLRAGPAAFAYIGNEENMRLACQVKVQGDMEVVTRPSFNVFGDGSFFS